MIDAIAEIDRILGDEADGRDVTARVAALPAALRAAVETALGARRAVLDGTDGGRGGGALVDVPAAIAHYRLLELIGRGGQGEVWRAHDERLGREVALKLLDERGPAAARRLRRFRREAAVASRLEHPGICPVYDVGESGGLHYIAMRRLDGQCLADVIAARVRAGDRPRTHAALVEQVALAEAVARALHAAHEAGIVHRDVKPSNIQRTAAGVPVLLDFGLAGDGDAESLTQAALGTPRYMAPEQVAGGVQEVDRRADVWALGVTLFELLVLQPPFAAPTREGLYREILHGSPPLARGRAGAHLPRDLRVVIATALERDRDRRYQTARDLADDLRRFCERRPVRARPPGAVARLRGWVRRYPIPAALLLALVVSLAFSLLSLRSATTERDRAERALQRSNGLRLLAEARAVREREPGLAVALALEGAADAPGRLAADAMLAILEQDIEDVALFGHDAAVVALEFGVGGRVLASVSDDGHLCAWRTPGGAALFALDVAAQRAPALAVHPRQRLLAVAADPDALALVAWDDGGAPRRTALAAPGVTAVAFAPGGELLAAATARGLCLWDAAGLAARASPARVLPLAAGVRALCFDAGGRRIALACDDDAVRVLALDDGEELACLSHAYRGLSEVAFAGEGVITASEHNDALYWPRLDAAEPRHLRGHGSGLNSVSVGPRGSLAVTASYDRSAILWDLATGRLLRRLRGHVGAVECVRLSPDAATIATASADGALRLWRTRRHPRQARHDLRHLRGVTCASFSADGTALLVATFAGMAQVIDRRQRRRALQIDTGVALWRVVASPDGSSVLTAGDGHAAVWDAATGARHFELPLPGARGGRGVTFSPGGDAILVTASDGTAALFDAATGAQRATIAGMAPFFSTGNVDRAAFSGDGRVVTATAPVRSGSIAVWRAEDGARLGGFDAHEDAVTCLARSPRPGWFATSSLDGSALVWPLDEPAAGVRLRGHAGGVTCVSFDAGGGRVVTASHDRTARVWDARTGACLTVLSGHASMLYSAVFSPDGGRVLTLSWDGTAALWDAATGERLLLHEESESPLVSAAFSPDGGAVAVASIQGIVRVWPTDPIAAARAWFRRTLGPAERARYR